MSIVDKFFREGQVYNTPEEVPENQRPPWHPSYKKTYQVSFTLKTFSKKPTVERELAFALHELDNKLGIEPTTINVTEGI